MRIKVKKAKVGMMGPIPYAEIELEKGEASPKPKRPIRRYVNPSDPSCGHSTMRIEPDGRVICLKCKAIAPKKAAKFSPRILDAKGNVIQEDDYLLGQDVWVIETPNEK